jgi:hypothetical protein
MRRNLSAAPPPLLEGSSCTFMPKWVFYAYIGLFCQAVNTYPKFPQKAQEKGLKYSQSCIGSG